MSNCCCNRFFFPDDEEEEEAVVVVVVILDILAFFREYTHLAHLIIFVFVPKRRRPRGDMDI